ncbi:serine hydrolase domain-containing protein [Pedobacter heparinus]|uniref:Beta-lactamase n=1 Tax=Pedobacter heparinus (strain ATCC 13125 / DSM 2366 / CIP 104194 / JCM 7457 / NBRC 12017 / NCIMB 9290 / NRRL B-14731 / HIM 762-3) TaxID=485917 RepID=C6Y2P9_PEDHD|nr:serine hydrolase domain-containing protein [Pedobacter heparinus]ACU05259.1 beta-lactamase [Pedobacter heparinus DSM 2366]
MKTFFTLLICVLSCISSSSQPRLRPNSIAQLTDSIRNIVRKRNIPGLMLGIVTKDSVLFSGGFGYADLKNKRAVNSKTLFRMGSITKSFVAIAILKLVEQGKLNLTDRLRYLAPEVPFTNNWENTYPVRLVNLLEHTTGFDDFKFNKMYTLERRQYSSEEMMLEQKASMVCRWRPSERYTYSNVNYAILGYIISKFSGTEYDQYLKESILLPLGMTVSNFNTWSRMPFLDTREYSSASGQLKEVPSVTLLPGAAASLWSSADEMNIFLQSLINLDSRLLSKKNFELMESPTSSIGATAGLMTGYALGNEDFGTNRGHDGTIGTCKSSYRYNRKLGYGFVLSSNANGLGSIETLINQYLIDKYSNTKKSEPLTSIPLNKKELRPYLGYYQKEDPRYNLLAFADRLLLLKVEIKNDTLQYNILGRTHQLIQTAPLVFRERWGTQAEIAFAINAEGKKVMIVNKHYTEKVPLSKAFSWLIMIILALVFGLYAVFSGIIAIGYILIKRQKPKSLHFFILPMLSLVLLSWGIYAFMHIYNNSYLLFKLGVPSATSISIFMGLTLFGISTLINALVLIKKLKTITSRYKQSILILTALSLLLIAGILLANGWIGLRFWKL